MPTSDIIVLLGTPIATIALIVRLYRLGARGRLLGAAAWMTFFGVALTLMMTTHCIEVIANTVRGGGTTMTGGPWRYDFRVYSLLLMGFLLLGLGVRVVGLTTALGRGDGVARRHALRTSAMVLALTAPLIPIHAFFGWIVSVLAAISLLVCASVARRSPAAPAPSARAEAGIS